MRTKRSGGRGAPTLDVDLYAEAALEDSRALFARIREAGPVVWLPRNGMYAIGRFDDVRAVLRDDRVFRSGEGVAANPLTNRLGRDTTLSSDDETHETRRAVLKRSLGAAALAAVQERLRAEARTVVERLVARRDFEATSDFASHLPATVVAKLVGVESDSERLLRWAAGTFNALGPLNRRGLRSSAVAISLLLYTKRLQPGRLAQGSWAASVFAARDRGQISTREARALVIDFVAPSLDTTILASTHLLWLLARNPEAWERIRAEPALIHAAVVENVRIASPIRGFTRSLACDHELGGVHVPAGARVAVLYASANLDETAFPDPERFDLDRKSPPQLGWGNGPHTCVGIHLSKLEMHALLEAMVPLVASVSAGRPQRLRNNTLQGIARLPAAFQRAGRAPG